MSSLELIRPLLAVIACLLATLMVVLNPVSAAERHNVFPLLDWVLVLPAV